MLVIHGIWARGALTLWAEDSLHPAPDPAAAGPTTGSSGAASAAGPHPFAAEPAELAILLADLAEPARDLVRKAAEQELTLWLPTARGTPQPSPLLSGPQPSPSQPDQAGRQTPPGQPDPSALAPGRSRTPSRVKVALAPWRIPALAFPASAALDLLDSLMSTSAGAGVGPGTGSGATTSGGATVSIGATTSGATNSAANLADPTAEVITGESVAYFSAVARFAADLAERARVLPGLFREDDGFAARWRPVLSGTDAERARDLAKAMPPLCRSASPAGGQPAALLAAALDAFADASARARLDQAGGAPALLPPRRGRRPDQTPVAEHWLSALFGADARVPVTGPDEEREAAQLALALTAWREAAQAPAGPVRTCFRLIEPEDEPEAEPDHGTGPETTEDWRVEFSLQSTRDPSLMLSAADIWSGTADWAGNDNGNGLRHADEELLAGLGKAARLFPELDTELRHPAPASAVLDTAGAFRFLKETGPLLSGAGFGVLLPDWARKARLGLKLTTRSAATPGTSAVTASGLGMRELVDFRYDLALGDDSLNATELEKLAQLKIPLVRLRGQWVELDNRNLRAALRFLERKREGTMTAADALLAGLRGPEEDLPAVSVEASGWLGDLLSGHADQRLAPVQTPKTFDGTLRPYQERGLAWLSFLSGLGLGGILADDMGLGKTAQTLALLAHDREAGTRTGPTLLVCPMSLAGNWQRETARFTPGLTVHLHHGADRLTGEALTEALTEADLVITTYAIAARDTEALAKIEWQRVVCDEAQNIKNSGTRQARAVRALPARTRIALTGTPVENRLSDLWSIMEFASPGMLGPAAKFRTTYAIPVERNADETAAANLRRLTGPFILRRLKTDSSIISDLPAKQEMKVWCNLTAEQASLYQATVADMLARIEAAADDGIERRGLVLATMAKLKQVCNHPAQLLGDGSRLPGRSGKLARLEEICDEIVAEGDKALCFTQYAGFGRMLQPHLTARLGVPVHFLHGGMPKAERDSVVNKFQGEIEPAVFLLSLKAGGTGLNLTAANHVIHVDRWWNPAVEDQATDRAFRIGQRKDVQVRKFVCVGTLEEKIDAMIEQKKALAERIVGTGESWLTELSVADLRKVIELSPDAVSA